MLPIQSCIWFIVIFRQLQSLSPAAPHDPLVPEPLQVNQPTNQPTNNHSFTHQWSKNKVISCWMPFSAAKVVRFLSWVLFVFRCAVQICYYRPSHNTRGEVRKASGVYIHDDFMSESTFKFLQIVSLCDVKISVWRSVCEKTKSKF